MMRLPSDLYVPSLGGLAGNPHSRLSDVGAVPRLADAIPALTLWNLHILELHPLPYHLVNTILQL